MREIAKIKKDKEQNTLGIQSQKVYSEAVKQQDIRSASEIEFDAELDEYKEETTRIQTRDLNKRTKFYAGLGDENLEQYQKDVELVEKVNKEIIARKQKRLKEIQEEKERKRKEEELKLQEEEAAKSQAEADMEEETRKLLKIQQNKAEKAKELAVKIGMADKKRRDKEYAESQRQIKKRSGLAFEIKESNRRKAIDRKILTKEEFAMKYHEDGY